jgi:hypothetical protein
MSAHKVTVGDKEFTIASPSLDKTMRITDYVAEILEEVPGIFDQMEQFRVTYRANHREILTFQDFKNPEYAPVIETLGFTAEDFEDEAKLIIDDAGNAGLAVYQSPSDFETIAAVFPKVWSAARSNLSDLCALLLITDGELEEHDKRGAVDALVDQRSHWLRHNATLEQLLELVSIGLVIVKEQIEAASESLGKVTANLSQMLGAEPAETEEPTPAENESGAELSVVQP